MIRFFLVVFFILCSLPAWSANACSSSKGNVRINEYFWGTGSSFNFVELASENDAFFSSEAWKSGAGFRALVYNSSGTLSGTYNYNTQTACRTGGTGWLTSGANGASLPTSGTVVLLDGNSDLVDYLSFGGAAPAYPGGAVNPSVCGGAGTFAYDTLLSYGSTGGSKGVRRAPDSVGNWALIPGSGSGTEGTLCTSNNLMNIQFLQPSYTGTVSTSITVQLRITNTTLASSGTAITSSLSLGGYTVQSFTSTVNGVAGGTLTGTTWSTGSAITAGQNATLTLTLLAPSTAGTTGISGTITAPVDYNGAVAYSSLIATAPAVGSIVISGSATPNVCQPASYTVTVRDSAGNPATTFTGSVSLTTGTGRGSWSLSTGSGTLTATANSGTGSYTFVAADAGVATFSLNYGFADAITLSASIASPATTGILAVNFGEVALIISSTDTLGSVAVAGRPYSMQAALWRSNGSAATPANRCSIDTGYTGSKTLAASRTLDALNPTGALTPKISATLPGALTRSCFSDVQAQNLNTTESSLALTFTSGVAPFYLCTADVGKFTANLFDRSRTYATGQDIGSVGVITTVRPFSLSLGGIQTSGGILNTGGGPTSGAAFTSAGSPFNVSVRAVQWAPTQDSVLAGQPNSGVDTYSNSTTPAYRTDTSISVKSQLPTNFSGALSGGTSVLGSSFASGVGTFSALRWSEVGSVSLVSGLANYLGSGVGILSNVPLVGRFYPERFVLASSSVSNTCTAGAFTYMDQSNVGLSAVIEARNALGAVVRNYQTGIYTVRDPGWSLLSNYAGSNLVSRLNVPSTTWAAGSYTISSTALRFSKSGVDGHYPLSRVNVQMLDADGARFDILDSYFTAAGVCASGACDAKAVSGVLDIRLGRMRLFPANSGSLIALQMPAQVEYFKSGVGWVVNTEDSCTQVPQTAFAFGQYQGVSGVSALAPLTFAAGRGSLRISAPTSGSVGKVEVGINLSSGGVLNTCVASFTGGVGANLSHLRSALCPTGSFDPSSTATWGSRSKGGSIIFGREIY